VRAKIIDPDAIIAEFRLGLADILSTYVSQQATLTLSKIFGHQDPFWRTHYLKVILEYVKGKQFIVTDAKGRVWRLAEVKVRRNPAVYTLYEFVFRRVVNGGGEA